MVWGVPITCMVNEEDFEDAVRFPLEGRPAAEVAFPIGEPRCRADHHIFELSLRGLPPTRAFARTKIRTLSRSPLKLRGRKLPRPMTFV